MTVHSVRIGERAGEYKKTRHRHPLKPYQWGEAVRVSKDLINVSISPVSSLLTAKGWELVPAIRTRLKSCPDTPDN